MALSVFRRSSVFGPVRASTTVRFRPWLAQLAAGGARPGLRVGRSVLRTDCAALLGLAAPLRNSLRALRALRSDNRSESVLEARCARGPQALCCSPPSDIAPAGPRLPRAGFRCSGGGVPTSSLQGSARVGGGAHRRRRAAQGLGPARVSALRELTRRRCLSAESEANAASSAPGPQDRAAQRSRRAAPTADAKRRRPPGHSFAARPWRTTKRTLNFRSGPRADIEIRGSHDE